jgi:hypothetical protein
MVAPRFSAIFLPISSGFTTQRPCPDFPSHLFAARASEAVRPKQAFQVRARRIVIVEDWLVRSSLAMVRVNRIIPGERGAASLRFVGWCASAEAEEGAARPEGA